MKTLIAVCLTASIAFAQAPADAPIADVPATSVRLEQGAPAPYAGYLISDAETLRRGKKEANERATLTDATANGVLLPKAAVATLISVGAAAVIAAIATGAALAAKK